MPAATNHNGRTRALSPLTVRLSTDERAEVDRRAAAAGQSVSDYVRDRLLGQRPRKR